MKFTLRIVAIAALSLLLFALRSESAPLVPVGQNTGNSIVDASAYPSLNAAVAASAGKTIIIEAPETLTASLVVPADVSVKIVKGGALKKAADFTVTINGPFEAGLYQVFSGFNAGEVRFANGSVKEVYPQWWGANVSSSINNALRSFGLVRVPQGVYLIDAEIQVPANTVLKGERGSVFKRPVSTVYPRSSMIVNERFTLDPPAYGDANIVIDGIEIDGNKGGNQQSHGNGIYIRSAQQVLIKNCTIYNNGKTAWTGMGQGILLSNVKDGRIEGNEVYGNDGDGINLYTKNIDIAVSSNSVHDNLVVGIEAEGRLDKDYVHFRNKGISLSGNIVFGNGRAGHGILIDWSDSVSVTGNIVNNNVVYLGAIYVLGCTDVTIDHNTVFDNIVDPASPYPKAGICIHPHVYGRDGISKNISITNNTIEETHEGVFIQASRDTTVAGNHIDTSRGAAAGIQVDGSCENILVKGNAIRSGAGGSGISLITGLDGIAVEGNSIHGGAKGIALVSPAGKYCNLQITHNLFDGMAYGVSAAPGVSLSNGSLMQNTFKTIAEKDLFGDRAQPVVLSSFFVQQNFRDKGTEYWNSVGVKPMNGAWKAGDRIINATPLEQGDAHKKFVVTEWLCSFAGSPGTWVELRSVTGD